MDRRAFFRFARYALVGGSTFAFDLLLIWLTVEFLGVPYYLATAIAFPIAVSVNYLISRKFVFKGSARHIHHGYAYFLLVALGGSLFVTSAVAVLVSAFALHYLVARALVACVVGIANYLFNLHLNFKVAGHHV